MYVCVYIYIYIHISEFPSGLRPLVSATAQEQNALPCCLTR